MPRYYFHTRIGNDLIADPEGAELRDPDQAWEAARKMIGELIADPEIGSNLLRAQIEVTDASGELILEFPFSEAVMDRDDDPSSQH